jgi:BCD family chlorophyll transporter-like MFS transporter
MIPDGSITGLTSGHWTSAAAEAVAVLQRGFWTVSLGAIALAGIGLIGLEPRGRAASNIEQRLQWDEMFKAIRQNRHATLFFWYLVVLLVALLGQDVILEAFAGQLFGMGVGETTRITSIWGTCFLVTLLAAGWAQSRLGKLPLARVGGWMALVGFLLLAAAGALASTPVFYFGLSVLGLGTGLSTVTNLSLMLDMTTPENVGLYMGAWGMANAVSRLTGQMMSGVVRDAIALTAGNVVLSYVVVFILLAVFLFASLLMLGRIDVTAFQAGAQRSLSLVERTALLADAGD